MYARLPVPKAIFLLPPKGMRRANIKHAEFAYYAFCVNILSIRRRVRTTKTVAFFAESRKTAPLCAKKLKIRPHRPDETALRRLRAFCISGYNKHYTRFCIQMMTLHLKINESAATITKKPLRRGRAGAYKREVCKIYVKRKYPIAKRRLPH